MTKLKKLIIEEYETLAIKMNLSKAFLQRLIEYKEKNGFVPDKYKKAYDAFIKSGGKFWDEQKAVKKRIMKTARLLALKRLSKEK